MNGDAITLSLILKLLQFYAIVLHNCLKYSEIITLTCNLKKKYTSEWNLFCEIDDQDTISSQTCLLRKLFPFKVLYRIKMASCLEIYEWNRI